MSAARTIQANPDMRPLGVAFGAIALAAAILVVGAVGQRTATQSQAAVAAPVAHDHGWSTASSASSVSAPVLFDRGWATDSYSTAPAVRGSGFDKAHAASRAAATGIAADGSTGVGLIYTGIPYTPSRATTPAIAADGSTGVGMIYTGIPYAPPSTKGTGGSNGTRFAQ